MATTQRSAISLAEPELTTPTHKAKVEFGREICGSLEIAEQREWLAWTDAKVGDWVVTPRIGKPVEANALWYNAFLQANAYF